MSEAGPVESVLIVGGGAAGWMTAAALARAFGRRLKITVVESEEIGTVGVGEATIPQIKTLNQFLGFDEDDFLRATQGTIKLGIEFNGWGRAGQSYIHAFGDIGAPLGMTPFHHYFLRARAGGLAGDLRDFSLNAAAAREGRVARLPRIEGTRLNGLAYAFHFDAALYGAYLRAFAEGAGVARREGRIVDVALRGEDGFIDHVTMADGLTLGADLFIDCSGFRALLIEGALGAGYDDWSDVLPCDRAVAVPCAHGGAFRPYTEAIADRAGWRWRIPLQHRVGNGHVYCSDHVDDDGAANALLAGLEGEALAEPRFLRFTTGVRRNIWVRNCVAVGLSSGFLEPLESTSIHLAQSAVSRLVSLFPDRAFEPALTAEFNRQMRFEMERIRDFLVLHYAANDRDDGPFWRRMREMSLPETLCEKVALFRESGRVTRWNEELFTENAWLQVFLGQNIEPARWHPLADALDEGDLREFLQNLRTVIARAVAAMDDHRAFIDKHCAAAAGVHAASSARTVL